MGRSPDNGLPKDTPVYPEPEAIRYELPVVVAGVKGTLVIRWWSGHDSGEMSIRGQAAEMLPRWWRR